MSRWNRNPEWLPRSPDGTIWDFISYKGRYLGFIMQIPAGPWMAKKFCCQRARWFDSMSSASCYVESTLSCGECEIPCPVLKSN